MINVYHPPQQILLVPTTHATYFGLTGHHQAYKYMIFKTQNKTHVHKNLTNSLNMHFILSFK